MIYFIRLMAIKAKVWKGRDVTLRGLLDGEHMRCYEQFHASG